MNNVIDHFAVGAFTLEQGIDALATLLGVEVPRGGKHDAMSTHNCVAQAGNSSFLEIIAIDPDAPDPGRARWFTLDEHSTQERLAERPRPLCWVVGTDDLDAVIDTSPIALGEVVTFTRGDRSWRLTVPENGSLPCGGLVPAFIEWSPGPHPSSGMQDIGIKLTGIEAAHPDVRWLTGIYRSLGVDHLVNVVEEQAISLRFHMQKPGGDSVTLV
ncbi:MAG: VOC family protein [Pseudomonadota bacterium]